MIELKSKSEIEKMADSGKILSEAMFEIRRMIRPGLHTIELDKKAYEIITRSGARPTFLGYGPAGKAYPASACISVNEVVVHGIPGMRELRDGDIVGIDLGVTNKGYIADAAYTFAVGNIPEEVQEFLQITENSLYLGIDKFSLGNRLGDISHAIQSYVESHGFSVVRDLTGHSVGKQLHEGLEVPNYGQSGKGVRLKEGMTLAIEPMINMGGWEVDFLPDGWTVVTRDRKLSAHYEHTVALTADGPRILTEFNWD
ncbi:MAG: type I methionyl aminopeptidase [Candidatus Wallbacteria bacterium]|nr:type I methionyl aminopeptidase [Candidatus Wallbacteria bacterium]